MKTRSRLARAMHDVCNVERRGFSLKFSRRHALVASADGAWAIRVASAREMGYGVRGQVVREKGLRTRRMRVGGKRG